MNDCVSEIAASVLLNGGRLRQGREKMYRSWKGLRSFTRKMLDLGVSAGKHDRRSVHVKERLAWTGGNSEKTQYDISTRKLVVEEVE